MNRTLTVAWQDPLAHQDERKAIRAWTTAAP